MLNVALDSEEMDVILKALAYCSFFSHKDRMFPEKCHKVHESLIKKYQEMTSGAAMCKKCGSAMHEGRYMYDENGDIGFCYICDNEDCSYVLLGKGC